MKLGVVFPQTEIGTDPSVIRDYAQTVEGLGYSHLVAFDHVLGVDPRTSKPEVTPALIAGARPAAGWAKRDWGGSYTNAHAFHEPFVLFSYLASSTTRLEFATGVLVLPQRQTALVAKQAACLSILCDGRLRLGVGVGWNPLEFRGMGASFRERGVREEEQICLLRKFWSADTVDFQGTSETVSGVGINPRPAKAPQVWIGGNSEAAMARAVRLGDGWMPSFRPEPYAEQLPRLRELLVEHGRAAEDLGVESFVAYLPNQPERWARHLRAWSELGVTHLAVDTMRKGLASPAEHFAALADYRTAAKETLGDELK